MNNIKYKNFSDVSQNEFISLLNNKKIRKHLIEHDLFTSDKVNAWINLKIEVDAVRGCKLRAVICENELAGWCGIQLEEEKYEIAIVLDDKYWGLGKKIFHDIMGWAKELGHEEIFIHFLYARPEYRFLQKIAKSVYETEMLGSKFTTYQLVVK